MNGEHEKEVRCPSAIKKWMAEAEAKVRGYAGGRLLGDSAGGLTKIMMMVAIERCNCWLVPSSRGDSSKIMTELGEKTLR